MTIKSLLNFYKIQHPYKGNLQRKKQQRYLCVLFEQYCEKIGEHENYNQKLGESFLRYIANHESNSILMFAKIFIADLNKTANLKQERKRKLDGFLTTNDLELVEAYSDSLKTLSKPKTVFQNALHAKRTLMFLRRNGITNLGSLDKKTFLNLLCNVQEEIRQENLSRKFLSYLYNRGFIKEDVSTCVPYIKTRKIVKPSVYTVEEIKKVIDSLDTTKYNNLVTRNMIILILNTGLRISDVVNLKITDINYVTQKIKITQMKTAAPITLNMSDGLKLLLEEYLAIRPSSDHNNLFVNKEGEPFNQVYASIMISTAMQKSGIEIDGRKKGPHTLRATYATILHKNGVNYDIIAALLGHQGMTSLKNYIVSDPEELKRCLISIPPLRSRLLINRLKDTKNGI